AIGSACALAECHMPSTECLFSVSRAFDFDQARIERRPASHIGKPFRSKGVDADSVRHELCPIEACGDHPRLHCSIDQRGQPNLTAIVKEANSVAFRDTAQLRIYAAHFQLVHFGLEWLVRTEVAKGRVKEVIGLSCEKL